MHGPLKRAGGVACLEGVRTPSRVAKALMEETDHHLIVRKVTAGDDMLDAVIAGVNIAPRGADRPGGGPTMPRTGE